MQKLVTQEMTQQSCFDNASNHNNHAKQSFHNANKSYHSNDMKRVAMTKDEFPW